MTDSGRWRPLHFRHRGRAKEYDALVDGVPGWLAPALHEWLGDALLGRFGVHFADTAQAIRMMQVELRVEGLDWRNSASSAYDSLVRQFAQDPDLFLSVVDYTLRRLGSRMAAEKLEPLLETAGSAWMVAPDGLGLVQRVVPEAVDAARSIIEGGSRAGQYLAEAWRHTYGRAPLPGSAYREAIRAMEATVCPVVLPKDPKATLGKAIRALKDAPPGKFSTVFTDTVVGVTPLDAVRGLIEVVWTNELDRHGTADDDVPLHVSQPQAEAALHAAITVVQWFSRGVVRAARR